MLIARESCPYKSCYCEENIWQLCDRVRTEFPDAMQHLYVAFISNHNKTVVLMQQTSSTEPPSYYVVWDYHVIAIDKQSQCVYDMDSRLSWPCTVSEYTKHAIQPNHKFNVKYRRKLRLIRADKYVSCLSTDRRHMRRGDVDWLQPPPDWPCIFNPDVGHNLSEFIDMSESNAIAESVVIDSDELMEWVLTD